MSESIRRSFAVIALASLGIVVAHGAQRLQFQAATRDLREVPLDAKRCRSLGDAEKKWLTHELVEFERFVIVCPLEAPRGRTVLYVLSVDGDLIVQTFSPNAIAPTLPKAIIVARDGARLGTLPYAFPFDPPVNLDVTFADWAGDFPRTIELYLEDPAVAGSRKLPAMKWDQKLKAFRDYPGPSLK
jgi:hypothetical protein